jgi:LmbE family N-acetylglucosaminyl deacetylase
MLDLLLEKRTGPLEVLCIGAHCDDIEIGCGGTLLALLGRERRVNVRWVVLSGDKIREAELRTSAGAFLSGAAENEVLTGGFKDSFFPYIGGEIKEYFERVVRPLPADIIFTHSRDDLHQDHRLVGELTWNTFRNHLILEYEIPKYDGDLGRPNLFVALEEETGRTKAETILRSYPSQEGRTWFREETFLSLMRLRGIEAGAKSGLAEGFTARKVLLGHGGTAPENA